MCGMSSAYQPRYRSAHSPPCRPVMEYGPGYDGWFVVIVKLKVLFRSESIDPGLIDLQILIWPPNALPAPIAGTATGTAAPTPATRAAALRGVRIASLLRLGCAILARHREGSPT